MIFLKNKPDNLVEKASMSVISHLQNGKIDFFALFITHQKFIYLDK